jgi:pyrroline-5-carboxylate reductase
MARALARGWGDRVLCSDSGSGRAAALAEELGGRAAGNVEVAAESDLVVLCHKPSQFAEVADEIRGHVRAVASVLGSIDTSALVRAYRPSQVFRLMPNTPVEIRRGAIVYSPVRRPDYVVDDAVEREVLALFARVGSVITVDESLIGPVLGVSGVGPAYHALLAEAQIDAAVRRGLKPAVAAQLVTETMAGTAALLQARGCDTLSVRREVTSPGGSTARGLDALERGGIRAAFSDAMDSVCEVAG